MHVALGWAFSARAPPPGWSRRSAIVTLAIWEKRWRELLRWELYVGLVLQAAMILHVDLVRVRRPGRHGSLEGVFLEQSGRPIHARRCPERNPIRGRAPQFSGEIPDRVAALPVSLDPAGHRRPAPRVAAARHCVRRLSPGALRPRRLAAGVGHSLRWPRPPETSTSPRRFPVSLCCSPGGRGTSRRARTAGICAHCARPPRCCWWGSLVIAGALSLIAVDAWNTMKFARGLHRDLRGRLDRRRVARASCVGGGGGRDRIQRALWSLFLAYCRAARGAGIAGVPPESTPGRTSGRSLAPLGTTQPASL